MQNIFFKGLEMNVSRVRAFGKCLIMRIVIHSFKMNQIEIIEILSCRTQDNVENKKTIYSESVYVNVCGRGCVCGILLEFMCCIE